VLSFSPHAERPVCVSFFPWCEEFRGTAGARRLRQLHKAGTGSACCVVGEAWRGWRSVVRLVKRGGGNVVECASSVIACVAPTSSGDPQCSEGGSMKRTDL